MSTPNEGLFAPLENVRVSRRGKRTWMSSLLVIIQAGCVVFILTYGLLFRLVRDLGAVGVLAVLLAGIASIRQAEIRRDWISYVPFLLFSLGMLVASLLEIMPRAWTLHFDALAAGRQWSWIVIFPILTISLAAALRTWGTRISGNALLLAIGCYLVGRISLLNSSSLLDQEHAWQIYGVKNESMIPMVLFVIWLYSSQRKMHWDALGLALLGVLAGSAGSIAIVLILGAIRFGGKPRVIFRAFFALMLMFLLALPLVFAAVDQFDPNTAIRGALWRDAAVAVWETNGIGVGFGTEAITGSYGGIRDIDFSLVASEDSTLFVGAHSLFYEILFRCGIFGLILWGGWAFAVYRKGMILRGRERKAFLSLAVLFLLGNSLNVGLASVGFVIGMAACCATALVICDPRRRDAANTMGAMQ